MQKVFRSKFDDKICTNCMYSMYLGLLKHMNVCMICIYICMYDMYDMYVCRVYVNIYIVCMHP